MPSISEVENSARAGAGMDVWDTVSGWRELAVRVLRRMYLPDERLFAFRIRKDERGEHRLEGISGRYTAIAVIGLNSEAPEASSSIFGRHSAQDVCARLIELVDQSTDIGEVALALWAARAMN